MQTHRIEVIDAAPGRVRLHVPGLWNDPAEAREIQRSLDAYPGVNSARLGLLTGNVTVDFDPDESEYVLECLDLLFPGAGLGNLELGRDLAEVEPSAVVLGRPQRPSRDAVRARATAKRRGLATVGFAVVGGIAGLILGNLLKRK